MSGKPFPRRVVTVDREPELHCAFDLSLNVLSLIDERRFNDAFLTTPNTFLEKLGSLVLELRKPDALKVGLSWRVYFKRS